MNKRSEKRNVRVYPRVFDLRWHLGLRPVFAAVALITMMVMISISRHFWLHFGTQGGITYRDSSTGASRSKNIQLKNATVSRWESYSLRSFWVDDSIFYCIFSRAQITVSTVLCSWHWRIEGNCGDKEKGKQLNLRYGYWRGLGALLLDSFSMHLWPQMNATLPACSLAANEHAYTLDLEPPPCPV